MSGSISMRCIALAALTAACTATAMPASAADPTVEVLHYWTSGSESKAINVFKKSFEKAGGKWIDSPVAGGGGDAMNQVLRSRVLAGNPPGMTVLKGPNVTEWAELGKLATLDDIAAKDNWKTILPPLLNQIAQYNGHYVAIPVDIHRVNWMWINPALFAKIGVQPPKTWDEFNTVAEKFKAAGITPLAHGGQPWQDATIFETVVLGIGGVDFYRKTMVEQDIDALGSNTMVKVFDEMRKIRGYVDDSFSGRDWNLATTMVMNGNAAMQIMGDWAKGEFLAAGKIPGKDFLCVATPGAKGYILNSNSFAFFTSKDSDADEGRKLLAHTMLTEPVEIEYTRYKGSIPARLNVSREGYDACALASMDDLAASIKADTLVPSMAHEMATSGAMRGAIVDVVTEHFNSAMTSQEAVKRLVSAVEQAK
ncbi:carbohydrate ABC transporter substrate-binding protein [Rhizobium lusitanum]|nr:carbohydrate ABC transporter substrate-binding protein [Rhizobium lusitanum]